jgi:hypothetical protein
LLVYSKLEREKNKDLKNNLLLWSSREGERACCHVVDDVASTRRAFISLSALHDCVHLSMASPTEQLPPGWAAEWLDTLN